MDRFKLEEQIMSCWNITDDLTLLSESFTPSKQDQILEGIVLVYEMKFKKLFDTFEALVQEGKIT